MGCVREKKGSYIDGKKCILLSGGAAKKPQQKIGREKVRGNRQGRRIAVQLRRKKQPRGEEKRRNVQTGPASAKKRVDGTKLLLLKMGRSDGHSRHAEYTLQRGTDQRGGSVFAKKKNPLVNMTTFTLRENTKEEAETGGNARIRHAQAGRTALEIADKGKRGGDTQEVRLLSPQGVGTMEGLRSLETVVRQVNLTASSEGKGSGKRRQGGSGNLAKLGT